MEKKGIDIKLSKLLNDASDLRKMKNASEYEIYLCSKLTVLDRKILNKYEKVWKETREMCKDEKILDMDEFDEKYPVFSWGLSDFIDGYLNFLDYCSEFEKNLLEVEISILEEVIERIQAGERCRRRI